MLKQPVSVVNYTNVAIVKLKIGKKRLEIACYKNKVQQYRQKVENDINEVLQVQKIFKNSTKGELIPKNELESLFPNMTYDEIIKLILDKGEIQVSEKERKLNFQNIKNDIANIIVEKTYNVETGLPFPHDIILQVLDDINFNMKEDKDAKKQALTAIKLIQDKRILPLERKLMQIFISLKTPKLMEKDFSNFKTEFLSFLNETNSQIIEQNTENAKQFKLKCNILPNHYREILTKYEEVLSIEILSNIVVLKESKPTDDTTSRYEYLKFKETQVNTNSYDNVEDSLRNMKISNQMIDKFLNDDKEDPSQPKKKKPMICTKCKDSLFYEQDELRKHFKTNWHQFNAKLSAQGKESLNVDEYDEYIIMHPEMLK